MISSFIIGILSLVIIILSYYLVKFKTLHGEERLRYATLKKQVTEEANLEKTNTAILTNSKELFLLKILRQLLENNPIGIINTTNGKMIRRTFEIKQLGVDFTTEQIKEQFPSARSYPIITIDEQFIGGYKELRDNLENT